MVDSLDPNDELPAFPPQVSLVQHPDMVNKSATPNTHIGSFNQTYIIKQINKKLINQFFFP